MPFLTYGAAAQIKQVPSTEMHAHRRRQNVSQTLTVGDGIPKDRLGNMSENREHRHLRITYKATWSAR